MEILKTSAALLKRRIVRTTKAKAHRGTEKLDGYTLLTAGS